MTDDRLERLESKLDAMAADIISIKLTLAEYRGARKAIFALAAMCGIIAGVLGRLLAVQWGKP